MTRQHELYFHGRWWSLHRCPLLPAHDAKFWFTFPLSAMDEKYAREEMQRYSSMYGWTDCQLVDLQALMEPLVPDLPPPSPSSAQLAPKQRVKVFQRNQAPLFDRVRIHKD